MEDGVDAVWDVVVAAFGARDVRHRTVVALDEVLARFPLDTVEAVGRLEWEPVTRGGGEVWLRAWDLPRVVYEGLSPDEADDVEGADLMGALLCCLPEDDVATYLDGWWQGALDDSLMPSAELAVEAMRDLGLLPGLTRDERSRFAESVALATSGWWTGLLGEEDLGAAVARRRLNGPRIGPGIQLTIPV